jgi:nucleotide-binding universal stress UspA family protein
MMNVRKILAATDFSNVSDVAMEVATKLARDFNATLVIAHVKPTPDVPGADDDVYDPAEVVERQQLEAIKPADSGVAFEHHLAHGRPSDELLRLAEKEAVDLIVIGTHGETNSPGVTMGAVAQAVLSRAACAVITVKPPTAQTACA